MQSQNQAVPSQNQRPSTVHSKMVRAGSKNYFFDVRQAKNGNNYLTIAESYKDKNGQSASNRIMIFKEHAGEFEGALKETQRYL